MGIFGLFTRKQRHIQSLLDQYLLQWAACTRVFREAWQTYLSEGVGQAFSFKVDQTHKEESRADDLRRQIELELYGKALLPESRGDILGVLESVDRLLTDAEWVLYELQLQELVIPESLRDEFDRLTHIAADCCDAIGVAVRGLFVEMAPVEEIRARAKRIDQIESESDHLERELIRAIFQLNMGAGKKVLLKDVVMRLARVSDRRTWPTVSNSSASSSGSKQYRLGREPSRHAALLAAVPPHLPT